MNLKIILFLFTCIHIVNTSFSQSKFVKQIVGATKHTILSTTECQVDCTIFAAGYSWNSLNVRRPILLKMDRTGNIVWSKKYTFSVSPNHHQQFSKITYSPYTNKITILGIFTNDTSTINDEYYALLCIIDTSGAILSSKKIKPYSDLLLYDLIATNDSGFMAIGMYNFLSPVIGIDTTAAILIKVDKNLNFSWSRMYFNSHSMKGISIVQLKDSGYVFTGTLEIDTTMSSHLLVVRTDKNGAVIWAMGTNLPFEYVSSYGQYSSLINDSSIVLTIQNYGGGIGGARIEIIKLDHLGEALNHKGLTASSTSFNNGFYITKDGGIKVLINYAFIATYDSADLFIDSHIYNPGPTNFQINCITKSYDNSTIIAGTGEYLTGSGGGGVILKTDSLGSFECNDYQINGPYLFTISSNFDSTFIENENIALTFTNLTYSHSDTLANFVDVCSVSLSEVNQSLKEIVITPNPSNGMFYLIKSFEEDYSVEISNSFGISLYKFSATSNEAMINLLEYPNGFYIVKILTKNKFRTFKLLKQ